MAPPLAVLCTSVVVLAPPAVMSCWCLGLASVAVVTPQLALVPALSQAPSALHLVPRQRVPVVQPCSCLATVLQLLELSALLLAPPPAQVLVSALWPVTLPGQTRLAR